MTEQARLNRLTTREHEVFSWLQTGKTNKVIALHLGISGGTVKIHMRSILRKLEVTSRVEAAVIAVQHGISPPDQIE